MSKQSAKTAKAHAMTGGELKRIRLAMGYQPRDMRATLGIKSRRTYEDYEAGKRRIPAEIAAKARQALANDRQFMTSLPGKLATRIDHDFPDGIQSAL